MFLDKLKFFLIPTHTQDSHQPSVSAKFKANSPCTGEEKIERRATEQRWSDLIWIAVFFSLITKSWLLGLVLF